MGDLVDVAIQQFRDTFITKYQARRKLEGCSQVVRGVVGDSYKWPLADKFEMQDRGAYQSIIAGQRLDYSRVTTSFSDKVGKIPTDIFEQANVNASERAILAGQHAAAIGRFEDSLLVAALDTTTNQIVNGGTNMTLEKLVEGITTLVDNNVPTDQIYCGVGASQLRAMLVLEKLTSADYVTVRSLMSGEINTFLGAKFIIFGTQTVGGLPKTGDIRSCFMWDANAVGMAYRLDPNIRSYWSDERDSWVAQSRISAGASLLQADGVIKIDCDES